MGGVEAKNNNPKELNAHSFNLIANNKAILFGGLDSNFKYQNAVFSLDVESLVWTQLSPKGTIPEARIWHGACVIAQQQLFVYGGVLDWDKWILANDSLHLLDFQTEKENGEWKEVKVTGKKTPGQRRSHSMVYFAPYICVFAGINSNSKELNDLWILNMSENPLKWEEVVFSPNSQLPCPRYYHATDLCKSNDVEILVLHGGLDQNNNKLNDTWFLKKQINKNQIVSWEWIPVCYKNLDYVPAKRYFVTFIYFLIIFYIF